MIFQLLTILSLIISVSDTTTVPDSSVTDSVKKEGARFMVLPIVFSSPDTRLAAGILPQVVFRTSSASNPSSIRLDAYYTLNRQYHILTRPSVWLDNNSKNISAKLSFKKWPTSFYGIGNRSITDNKEKFTETLYEGSLEASTLLKNFYYGGISYSLRSARVEPHEDNGILASGELTGSGRSLVSSAGLVLRRDSRDHIFFPGNGSYHTLEVSLSSKWLGSDYNFSRYTLDLRKYISLKSRHVLAVQSMFSVTAGNSPFRMLPSVGSTLRGYSSVRYIDRNLAAFRLEYRAAPLFGRFGIAIFAGAGDVFEKPSDLSIKHVKYTFGLGIRYLYSRSEKINIRLDYGFGKDSSGDYIDLNEAY